MRFFFSLRKKFSFFLLLFFTFNLILYLIFFLLFFFYIFQSEEAKLEIFLNNLSRSLGYQLEQIQQRALYLETILQPSTPSTWQNTNPAAFSDFAAIIINQKKQKTIIFKTGLSKKNLNLLDFSQETNNEKFSLVNIQKRAWLGFWTSNQKSFFLLDKQGAPASLFANILEPENYDWRLLLLDSKGKLLFHSHQNLKDFSIEQLDLSHIDYVKKALLGDILAGPFFLDGKNYLSFSSSVPNSRWLLLLQIPQALILEQAIQLVLPLFLISLIFIALFFFPALWGIKHFFDPLEKLTEALHQYGKNNPLELKENNNNDEIGRAILSYNQMLKDRQKLEKEVLSISEKERQRIGQDIHDDLGQILTGASFILMALKQKYNQDNTLLNDLEKLSSLLELSIKKSKSIARSYCPALLLDNDFSAALEELCESTRQIYPVKCRLAGFKDFPRTDKEKNLQLFYIIQEALGNALRHGKADKIDIQAKKKDQNWHIDIIDNGRGIGNPEILENSKGLGLKNMRYRCKIIKANLKFISPPSDKNGLICRIIL